MPHFSDLIGSGGIGAFSGGGLASASSSFDSGIVSQLKAAFDFVKLEIFGNFFQQMGLWFARLRFPDGFRRFFEALMDFVSLVWAFVMGITDLNVFYIWNTLISVLMIIWMIQKYWDPVREVQGPNTYGWSERGKLFNYWTEGMVTAITFIYLSSMTSVFEVLFCFESLVTPYEMSCYEGDHLGHFFAALVFFIFIGFFMPYQVYLVINKYQPKPHDFDETGRKIDQKEDEAQYLAQYRMLLDRDTCPYNFLYVGYEYGWSAYKVISMIIKMLLVFPNIPFFDESIASIVINLVIVFFYALISGLTRPFILPQDDWIDLSARVTSVLTLIIQICDYKEALSDAQAASILNVLHFANLFVMIGIFVIYLTFVQNFIRKHFGQLKFSKGDSYDFKLGRKQRIWQRFWRGIFSQDPAFEAIYRRLVQMEDIVTNYGYQAYKTALFSPEESFQQARRMALELEGVDIYYHDNVESTSYWGRLFIDPFPFKCNVIYDESNRISSFGDEYIKDFIRQNLQDTEVRVGRSVRKTLRVFKDKLVQYPFEQIMDIKISTFGKDTRLVSFKEGTLRIQSESNDRFSHGFRVSIEFDDGTAVLEDGTIITGIKHTIGHNELGISSSFGRSQQLIDLFTQPDNKKIIDSDDIGFKDIIRRDRYYRHDLEEQRAEEEYYASYLFWYMVFNNDTIPRDELGKYFNNNERNPALKELLTMDKYKDDFDGLYSRLAYYDSHPAISYWYCFFDDIMLKNSTIKKISTKPDLFDLTNPSALAYHPQSVDELRTKFEERKLRTSKGRGLFNDKILGKLDANLETYGQKEIEKIELPYIKPTSAAGFIDPRCASTPLITENTTMIAQAFSMAWSS